MKANQYKCLFLSRLSIRTKFNRINGLHKKALSLVCNDFSSNFAELLEKEKSVTMRHHRNLHTLAYEIFKAKNKTGSEILTEIFSDRESQYRLRNSTTLQGRSIKNVICGSETRCSLVP